MLKPCEDCDHPTSSKAISCPNCGKKLSHDTGQTGCFTMLFALILGAFIIQSILSNIQEINSPPTPPASKQILPKTPTPPPPPKIDYPPKH